MSHNLGWTDCCTLNYNLYVVSPGQTIDNIVSDTLPANPAFSVTNLIDPYSCPPPITTSTTTTTTTLVPILRVVNGAVSCVNGSGTFQSTFTNGTGVYTKVALDNSQANVVTTLNGGNSGSGVGRLITLSPTDTYYYWTAVADGTWYTAIKDSGNTNAVQNTPVTVNCVI